MFASYHSCIICSVQTDSIRERFLAYSVCSRNQSSVFASVKPTPPKSHGRLDQLERQTSTSALRRSDAHQFEDSPRSFRCPGIIFLRTSLMAPTRSSVCAPVLISSGLSLALYQVLRHTSNRSCDDSRYTLFSFSNNKVCTDSHLVAIRGKCAAQKARGCSNLVRNTHIVFSLP